MAFKNNVCIGLAEAWQPITILFIGFFFVAATAAAGSNEKDAVWIICSGKSEITDSKTGKVSAEAFA